jgi:Amt family ammonium transporter
MLVAVMAAVALLGPLALAASAQTDITDVALALDEVWVVIAGMLVMFMQAGFALVES